MKSTRKLICNRYIAAWLIAIVAELIVYEAIQYGVVWWVEKQDSDLWGLVVIWGAAVYAALACVVLGCFAAFAVIRNQYCRSIPAFIVAVLGALEASFLCNEMFRWVFIKIWERQHGGRPMKFTMWADERALPSALLISPLVFLVVFRLMQRRRE